MTIVAFDKNRDQVLRLEKDGARYLHKITIDPTDPMNKTITLWGQSDKTITLSWNDLRVPSVAAGENHSLFLDSNGTVWAWGRNTYGALGDGTTDDRNGPVQVKNLFGVIAVAGCIGSLALDENGK
jgi:alpha-tubulin suppressor-like RCC1 family protein